MKQSFALKIVTLPIASLMLLGGLSACTSPEDEPPREEFRGTLKEIDIPQEVVDNPFVGSYLQNPLPTVPVPMFLGTKEEVYTVREGPDLCSGGDTSVYMESAITIEISADEYISLMRDVFANTRFNEAVRVPICMDDTEYGSYPELASQVVDQEVAYLLTVRDE